MINAKLRYARRSKVKQTLPTQRPLGTNLQKPKKIMTTELLEHIKTKKLDKFKLEWNKIKNELSEKQKQNLLIEIVDEYYDDIDFSFYIKIFDSIIKSKVSLDFNIEHWAPTFLSLIINKVSQQLFDYFVYKGASINFISDTNIFLSEFELTSNTFTDNERFWTCLDFAELKLANMFSIDYNYPKPNLKKNREHWSEINIEEKITIKKTEYLFLIEQTQYLYDIIHLDKIIDYIKLSGGKCYNELKNK